MCGMYVVWRWRVYCLEGKLKISFLDFFSSLCVEGTFLPCFFFRKGIIIF